jgi:hypothetical protein
MRSWRRAVGGHTHPVSVRGMREWKVAQYCDLSKITFAPPGMAPSGLPVN